MVDIIATKSPIFPPFAINGNAERFEKPGERYLILYGLAAPSLTIKTHNSPLGVSTRW